MSNDAPSKLTILKTNEALKKVLLPINTGAIFIEGNKFHPLGLYSVEVFGPVGTEARTTTFARINLNIKLLQPIVYKNLIELGSIYLRVMEGKEYVEFDTKLNDLVPSTSSKAETGYNTLIKYLPKIKFKQTESEKRDGKIKLIYDAIASKNHLTDYLVVLPAGLRDYTIGADGRPTEDEVNNYYKRIINSANLIDPNRSETSPELYDNMAIGLQKCLHELYLYIMTLLDGKNKLIEGKWMARKVFNSTANVASSYVDTTKGLLDKRKFGYNDTRIGLHQYARSSSPLSIYHIKNKYISDIFVEGANTINLTNSKTLKREQVVVSSIQKEATLWTTTDGIEKIIASLSNYDIVHDPITFTPQGGKDVYYMGLLYKDKKKFKFFQDIDDLPEGYDKSKVKPVSLYQFIYMSIYSMSGKYPGMVTRYPISGIGSSYPSWIILTTTIETDVLMEMDYNWEVDESDNDRYAINFPIEGSAEFKTFTVNVAHLSGLGGDGIS